MALGNRADPYLSHNYLVEIAGLIVGGFSEVTGLQSEIEVEDYREGGVNGYMHKLAGPTRYPSNLSLQRGVGAADMLWLWYQAVTLGRVIRNDGVILLLDSTGQVQRSWMFVGAYPVRWIGPSLRARTAEVAIETLELVHRGLFVIA